MSTNKGCLGHNAGKPKEHLLSQINPTTRTAICATCGQVPIFKAGKKPDGTQLWRCHIAVKKTAKPRTTDMQPRQHFLSEINEAERTAICACCGPVKIQDRGSEYKGKRYWRCSIQAADFRKSTKGRTRQRHYMLNRNYGISPEQYQAMHDAQGGRCAICQRPGGTDRMTRLHVDHDHNTGAVRSLLCKECNTGIGAMRDTPHYLRAAANYVEYHSELQRREESTQSQLGIKHGGYKQSLSPAEKEAVNKAWADAPQASSILQMQDAARKYLSAPIPREPMDAVEKALHDLCVETDRASDQASSVIKQREALLLQSPPSPDCLVCDDTGTHHTGSCQACEQGSKIRAGLQIGMQPGENADEFFNSIPSLEEALAHVEKTDTK